ncbi:MAG: glutathione S-transferase [Stappiaceae bacterium]
MSRTLEDTHLLTVFGRRNSFNVQKVLWFLDEIKRDYSHVDLGGSFGGLDDPMYRLMNPHGTVPFIDDGGTIVWESHAILRYLAATYGADQFWHDDPKSRAQVDQWMDWSQTALQPAFLGGIFWGYYRTPAAQRDISAINIRVAECARYFTLLDDMLAQQQFIIGDRLSLADIPIGTHLFRYFGVDIERPPIANVERWYRRLQERQGYSQHVMMPFDDLFGRLAP